MPQVLEQLAESVREFEPHLLVVTGDLTQRARLRQFESARRFLDSLPYPQLIDRLIALAIERHTEKQQLRTSM